jgi:SMC interacting uncharacterized protein involved in chromosome segregation
MTEENLTPPGVPDMLRLTGANQHTFMEQVAAHIEKLEKSIQTLKARIDELELQNELGVQGVNNSTTR